MEVQSVESLFPPASTKLPSLWFPARVCISFPPNFFAETKITNHIDKRCKNSLGQNKFSIYNEFIQISFQSSLENSHFLMHYPLNIVWVIRDNREKLHYKGLASRLPTKGVQPLISNKGGLVSHSYERLYTSGANRRRCVFSLCFLLLLQT